MVHILNIAGQHGEAVDLCRDLACENAIGAALGRGQFGGGPGGIGGGFGGDAMLLQKAACLRQKHQMRADMFDVFQCHAGAGHQGDAHPHEGFADDMQPAFRQQAVNIGHPAIGRVLDRQHGQLGAALVYGPDNAFERLAGHRFHVGAGLKAGLVTIGAKGPLEGDARRGLGGHGSYPAAKGAEKGNWSR